MAKKLKIHVHAVERDDKGNVTNSGVFGPDDELPSWAEKAITNPDVWDGTADPQLPVSVAGPKPPPRSGTGSGADAWRAYAADQGVDVPADAERADVITALEAADKPTK